MPMNLWTDEHDIFSFSYLCVSISLIYLILYSKFQHEVKVCNEYLFDSLY